MKKNSVGRLRDDVVSIIFVCMDGEDDSMTADNEGDCDDEVIFDNSSRSSNDDFDGDDATTFCEDDDGAAILRGNGGTAT